ncbi:hypothetical protein NDU88_002593 [Pleurodeles waltl]|uniref:Reverse transcriptase domain-containing protein n=1 Tax=Pleurodeles waltl TaxID=8319 RepID=A0AAV7UW67_PLEWA|nr:hypothetical protein NDU88_002593 [Pleurodeles waltl]
MCLLGLGIHYIKAVQAIYYKHVARIQLMGGQSGLMHIERGTQEGCPCSPLLFALYIKPFIHKMDANPTILPAERHGWDMKMLAYADDVAVLTTNPDAALQAMEEEATKFRTFSGYQLNSNKTQLVVNNQFNTQDFRVVEHVVYLEIQISTSIDRSVELNLAQ